MSESVFYGAVVSAKKPLAVVPRPHLQHEPDEVLHLSQVCVPATSALPLNTRVSLLLKLADSDPICIATLKVGHVDSFSLSVLIDEYAELSVAGHKGAEVHVSGFFSPSQSHGPDDDEDDEEDDDGEGMTIRDRLDNIEDYLAGIQDDDDDDDDEDEAEEGEDDEDDDDEDDDEDMNGVNGELPGETRTKHTHIKELKGEGEDDDDEDDDDDDAEAMDVKDEEGEEKDGDGEDDEDEDEEDGEEEDEEDDEGEDVADEEGGEAELAELMERIAEENAKRQAAKKRKADDTNGEEPGKKGKVDKKVFSNGFEIQSVKAGPATGKQAKPGKRVVVKYCGKLQSNGKIFDETKGNKTFSFRLGVGEVIKGWDKGVAGMRVGDKRKLVIPPSLGYGATGVKNVIPPNSTLLFDVELVDVR